MTSRLPDYRLVYVPGRPSNGKKWRSEKYVKIEVGIASWMSLSTHYTKEEAEQAIRESIYNDIKEKRKALRKKREIVYKYKR
jgi:hypothetical protein